MKCAIRYKIIKKMHHNLGHPGQKTFENMLRNSTFKKLDCNLINKLYQSCQTCFKFKNSKPKSKVGPPMAQDFNHELRGTGVYALAVWPGAVKTELIQVSFENHILIFHDSNFNDDHFMI